MLTHKQIVVNLSQKTSNSGQITMEDVPTQQGVYIVTTLITMLLENFKFLIKMSFVKNFRKL